MFDLRRLNKNLRKFMNYVLIISFNDVTFNMLEEKAEI